MLHDLMRFSFLPPMPCFCLTLSFLICIPSSLSLSFRYALPSHDNGRLCIIEIAVDNGTANRQQKYMDEPVSEVNLLLHIQSFEWLSVYILSMNELSLHDASQQISDLKMQQTIMTSGVIMIYFELAYSLCSQRWAFAWFCCVFVQRCQYWGSSWIRQRRSIFSWRGEALSSQPL